MSDFQSEFLGLKKRRIEQADASLRRADHRPAGWIESIIDADFWAICEDDRS